MVKPANMNVNYGGVRLEWNEKKKEFRTPPDSYVSARAVPVLDGQGEVVKLKLIEKGGKRVIQTDGREAVSISVYQPARKFAPTAKAFMGGIKPSDFEKLYLDAEKRLALAEKRIKGDAGTVAKSKGFDAALKGFWELRKQVKMLNEVNESKPPEEKLELKNFSEKYEKVRRAYSEAYRSRMAEKAKVDVAESKKVQMLVGMLDNDAMPLAEKARRAKELMGTLEKIAGKGAGSSQMQISVDGEARSAGRIYGWAKGFVDRGGFRNRMDDGEKRSVRELAAKVKGVEVAIKKWERQLIKPGALSISQLAAIGKFELDLAKYQAYSGREMGSLLKRVEVLRNWANISRQEAGKEAQPRMIARLKTDREKMEAVAMRAKSLATAGSASRDLARLQAQFEVSARRFSAQISSARKLGLDSDLCNGYDSIIRDAREETLGLMPMMEKITGAPGSNIYSIKSRGRADLRGGPLSYASSRLLMAAREAKGMGANASVHMIYAGLNNSYASEYKKMAADIARETGVTINVEFRRWSLAEDEGEDVMIAVGEDSQEAVEKFCEEQTRFDH